jgi:predicted DsbA family dithiol-disulfide isomerase
VRNGEAVVIDMLSFAVMPSAARVHLVVWSDYLCPWCYVGTTRLERLEHDLGSGLTIEWRAFLLRPMPDPGRTLERFRTYTQSWLRPAAEEDAPPFRPWATDAGPPSHSIPPHVVAKAAVAVGPAAFHALHGRLLRAYFEENRDITERATLQGLWREAGLDDARFPAADAPALEAAVLADHRDALAHGVTGVPSVMLAGTDVPMLGALPYETYRRWVTRAHERA